MNGAQCRSLKKAALIDLEQEMRQWSLMRKSGTVNSVITSGLFVYIWSIRVADVCVILVGDFTRWVMPSSVIVASPRKSVALVNQY